MNTGNTRRRTSEGAQERRGRLRLALLCVAQFVVVLDVTIVAIALPAIRRDLGFDPADLQWVLSAYTLTFGSQNAKKPETRARRIVQFVEMCSRGETVHPPRRAR
jgi:Bacteriocin-protection, YdeI or OmpD-Associated